MIAFLLAPVPLGILNFLRVLNHGVVRVSTPKFKSQSDFGPMRHFQTRNYSCWIKELYDIVVFFSPHIA